MNTTSRLVLGTMFALCNIVASVSFAFTPDNRLLNSLYDKIDAVYATAPQKVVRAYTHLTYAKVKAAPHPAAAYYLEKLAEYIHGKLFTFTEQPNFVCLDTYVQKNDTVEVDYTIKQLSGSLITTTLESVAREMGVPTSEIANMLAFNPGNKQVMKWLDTLVLWAIPNTPLAAVVEPKDAYGTYSDSKRITFSGDLAPVIQVSNAGERVLMQVMLEDGAYMLIGTVVEKTANHAIVDFNHPHAGETVLLSAEVMKLFKACHPQKSAQ